MNTLLITGTGARAGKTVVLSALAAYWQTYCSAHSLGLIQPIAVNDRDRTLYNRLFSLKQAPEEFTPEHIETELPLPVALQHQGRSLSLERIWRQLQLLMATHTWVLMEGLGSLGTPLTSDTVMADLAWDWRLPTLLVAPVQAEAIAQVMAQVALARQRRVHLKGIVFTCQRPYTADEIEQLVPVSVVRSLTQTPVLGCIPYLSDPSNLADLAQAASSLALELILPITPQPRIPA